MAGPYSGENLEHRTLPAKFPTAIFRTVLNAGVENHCPKHSVRIGSCYNYSKSAKMASTEEGKQRTNGEMHVLIIRMKLHEKIARPKQMRSRLLNWYIGQWHQS